MSSVFYKRIFYYVENSLAYDLGRYSFLCTMSDEFSLNWWHIDGVKTSIKQDAAKFLKLTNRKNDSVGDTVLFDTNKKSKKQITDIRLAFLAWASNDENEIRLSVFESVRQFC